jgi:hypothetical protein
MVDRLEKLKQRTL